MAGNLPGSASCHAEQKPPAYSIKRAAYSARFPLHCLTWFAQDRLYDEARGKPAGMGYNACPRVHTDIISTTNRTVTARLRNGSERIIYQDGQFVLE